ncbi:glycosyltransferase [Mucilaginibacter terrenus]|uniref:Glycosyltransferase n=1 Tax=Mucilaginibacter terrenus TaxID=2482727 RepID=A0A3E2NPC7_9SPHI|nr:glycosyltransferase family 4 protein [Mucilaginibacter terrenus]RFZ82848.1 glycosyltransferase [Mucilaginibacter terrenus]
MRILILTHRVPFPQNGGYPIVVGNTIKGLVSMGHEVSLISINVKKHSGRQHERDDLLNKISYTEYGIDTHISVLEVFSNLFTRNPYNINKYYDAGFEKLVLQNIKDNHYDVVQLEGLFVGPYVAAIRKNTTAKLIYRAHNIEHQVWHRLAHQKNDPFKKWYLNLLARRVKKYELELLNQFDGIAVFTGEDKNAMESFGAEIPLCVVPIGVDMGKYQPEPDKTECPSLFFLGSLDWLPNREGIEWFIENFHKEIVDGDLKVKFYVAGNSIPEDFDEYDVPDKVFIQGEVDDALEFVNSKSIMIVPLLSGGGMRVKIVEGMAMKKCIISTTIGAEGINFAHGDNIIIANNAGEFYDALKRCIADEWYCREIGENARKLVEQEHDVNKVTRDLVAFYQSVI